MTVNARKIASVRMILPIPILPILRDNRYHTGNDILGTEPGSIGSLNPQLVQAATLAKRISGPILSQYRSDTNAGSIGRMPIPNTGIVLTLHEAQSVTMWTQIFVWAN